MDAFLRYQRTLFLLSFVLGLALSGLLGAFVDWRWGLGFAIGCVAGLIKFRLDVRAILRLAECDVHTGNTRPFLRTTFQTYFLMAAALAVGILWKDYFEVWGIFAGILLPRAVLILDGMIRPGLFQETEETENQPTLVTGEAHEG